MEWRMMVLGTGVLTVGMASAGIASFHKGRADAEVQVHRAEQRRRQAEGAARRAREAQAAAEAQARSVTPDSLTIDWLPYTPSTRRVYARLGLIKELSQFMGSRRWDELHGRDLGTTPGRQRYQDIEVTAFGQARFLMFCDAMADLPQNDGCVLTGGDSGFHEFTRQTYQPVVVSP